MADGGVCQTVASAPQQTALASDSSGVWLTNPEFSGAPVQTVTLAKPDRSHDFPVLFPWNAPTGASSPVQWDTGAVLWNGTTSTSQTMLVTERNGDFVLQSFSDDLELVSTTGTWVTKLDLVTNQLLVFRR